MGLGDERFARPAWNSKRSELIKRLRRSLKIATPEEKVVPTCPSTVTKSSSAAASVRSVTSTLAGKMTGRTASVCADTGVTTIVSSVG